MNGGRKVGWVKYFPFELRWNGYGGGVKRRRSETTAWLSPVFNIHFSPNVCESFFFIFALLSRTFSRIYQCNGALGRWVKYGGSPFAIASLTLCQRVRKIRLIYFKNVWYVLVYSILKETLIPDGSFSKLIKNSPIIMCLMILWESLILQFFILLKPSETPTLTVCTMLRKCLRHLYTNAQGGIE